MWACAHVFDREGGFSRDNTGDLCFTTGVGIRYVSAHNYAVEAVTVANMCCACIYALNILYPSLCPYSTHSLLSPPLLPSSLPC